MFSRPDEPRPDVPGDEPSGPSLAELGRQLTTPARSGFLLTKQQLGLLATELGLPLGFGERAVMLANLFRAAAELRRLPELVARLQAETDRWEARYAAWAAEYPASAPIWQPWRKQLGETRAVLEEMAAAVAEEEG